MSDFQDRAYMESVSFTRAAILGTAISVVVEALIVGAILGVVFRR